MKRYVENLLTGVSVFVLGLIMILLTNTQIQEASLAGVSPRAIPLLVAKSILFLAAITIVKAVFMFIKESKSGLYSYSTFHFEKFPFLLFLLMLGYVIAMALTGYFLASFIILPIIMHVLKVKTFKNYLILMALIIFVYVVIDLFLHIRLPKLGLWGVI